MTKIFGLNKLEKDQLKMAELGLNKMPELLADKRFD